MNKKTVAILIALNDIEIFAGGSRNGLKSTISYFQQFLILYESIKVNWKGEKFNYFFVLLHSKPFSSENLEILKKLDVKVMHVSYSYHDLKIRPLCYSVPIECDYRLVLDVDMLAINEPNFDFKHDFLAMYGGNKYNKKQWNEICVFLGCEMPKFKVKRLKKGSYNVWRFREHYLYHMGKINKRIFPYFNNGAILINNDITFLFFKEWENNREKYTQYVKAKQNIDIDLEGQDVVGISIDQVTSNWNVFQPGVNFILQDFFDEGVKLRAKYRGEFYLIHYIHVERDNPYYNKIKEYQEKVIAKYY